jgi:hypothetical protein
MEIRHAPVAPNRFADQIYCGLVVTALICDHAEKMQAFRVVWLAREDFPVKAFGLIETAGAVQAEGRVEGLFGLPNHGRSFPRLVERNPARSLTLGGTHSD